MSSIELYADEAEAVGARDYYNHSLGRRAVVVHLLGSVAYEDYYGGTVFIESVAPDCWMLVVEDQVEEE